MRLFTFTYSIAPLLGVVQGFYPYHHPQLGDGSSDPPSPPSRRSIPLQARRSHAGISFPIRRMPKRRSNQFNIVHASPPKQSHSAGVDQDGTDYSYFCEIQFGSKKNSFYLLLDTAAANTWVMSDTCTTSACTSHNVFGVSSSTSLQTSQTPFSITYGSGSVSGTTATDNVFFIGATVSLTFGLASSVSDDFASYPMDGILGLGRAENAQDNQNGIHSPTLLDLLVSSKTIPAKQFGLRLSRNSDGSNNGEINLGAPDLSVIDGSLDFIAAVTNGDGFWEIPIGALNVGGKPVPIPSGRTALLDSGTSFILMPSSDAAALHSPIAGSVQNGESFTIPCDTQTPLSLTFNGKTYNINYKDYVGPPVSPGKCNSNIVARQVFEDNQWLVGDVFLKNVYTVFDFDGGRIGLGNLKSISGGTSTAVAGEGTITPTANENLTTLTTTDTNTATLPTHTLPTSKPIIPAHTASTSTTTGKPGATGTRSQTTSGSGKNSPSGTGSKTDNGLFSTGKSNGWTISPSWTWVAVQAAFWLILS